MSDRIKLKELEDCDLESFTIQEKTDSSYDKISLDNLPSEEQANEKKTSLNEKNKQIRKTDKVPIRNEAEPINTCEYDHTLLYFFRGLSCAGLALSIDLAHHFLKTLDGVDVFDFNMFQSIFYSPENLTTTTLWAIAYLIIVFVSVSLRPLSYKLTGIYAISHVIRNGLFFSDVIFVPWDEIKDVELQYSFFEPYLVFFDKDYKTIGKIPFLIENKKQLLVRLRAILPPDHPIIFKSDKLF